jgi:polysaccharide export outer membrane protein
MRLSTIVLASLLVATAAAAQPAVDPDAYRIGARDLIEIRVFELPELNVEQRVNESGTISLPIVGEYQAAGFTTAELAQHLEALLEEAYVERASVTVELVEFRSAPISVLGAVKKPGDLAFSGDWTLLEAITAAGGLAETHGNAVHVLRRSPNGLSDQVSITVEDLLVRADPDANIPLFANDLVNVENAVPVNIYCLGEVASPGALQFRSTERITVLSAIARAGGLTERASAKIRIKRPGANGGEEVIEVNYKKILAGEQPDLALESNDVLFVPESFF